MYNDPLSSILISMHVSNRFVIVRSIQSLIRMLYHSFETLLLLRFFYLVVKSAKSFVELDLVSKQPFSFYLIEISSHPA